LARHSAPAETQTGKGLPEMHVSAIRTISLITVLVTLGGHALSAAAQDVSFASRASDRTVQGNPSSGFVDDAGIRLDMAQEEMLVSLKAYSAGVLGNSLILGRDSLQESDTPGAASTSSLRLEAEDESVHVESADPPLLRLVSRLNQGPHSPLLKQATIANMLADLKKKYGSASMAQSGNFRLSFAWQRTLASDRKTPNVVACNKMSRWSSICASADANNTFSVYFKGS
jgi:hypothetical protein